MAKLVLDNGNEIEITGLEDVNEAYDAVVVLREQILDGQILDGFAMGASPNLSAVVQVGLLSVALQESKSGSWAERDGYDED